METGRARFLERLNEAITTTTAWDKIEAALARGTDATLNIPSFARAAWLAAAFTENPQITFVVVPTGVEARRLQQQLGALLGQDCVLLLPDRSDLPWALSGQDPREIGERARALWALQTAAPVVVVVGTEACLRRVAPPSLGAYQPLVFERDGSATSLQFRDRTGLDALAQNLVRMGYRRQAKVDGEGSFSLVGDVLNLWPPLGTPPVRVDFFDDEIESIRSFLPASGQVIANLPGIELWPLEEFIPRSVAKKLVPIDAYVGDDARVCVLEPKAIFDVAMKRTQALRENSKSGGEAAQREAYYVPGSELNFGGTARLIMRTLAGQTAADAEFKARKPHAFSSDDQVLVAVRELLRTDTELTLALPLRRHREHISDLLIFAGITVGETPATVTGTSRGVRIIDADVRGGFILTGARFALLTTAELFPRALLDVPETGDGGAEGNGGNGSLDGSAHAPGGSGSATSDPTKLTFAFKPGDYVVHSTYGIALFTKVAKRTVDGVTRDYLWLKYGGGDMLYTPVDQIDKISKYVGANASEPHLTRLGGKSWQRATTKARAAAKQLAFDLADLYTRRKAVRGYAYEPDTPAQAEMEARFGYEETPDQLAAIADVKADMESPRPMDRLIIGDVGYGKTEVALRAAFKAAQDNKQTMVLCPTTILTQQHFTQFSERFEPFNVRVEVLSRFRTPVQQREALKGFATGDVAVLIGTHRLLSADVVPRDLGLLIIDEEQRFGVGAKEQLKNLREQIDVLALSATPIPRTLQMSLSGVRDLSVIDTPPTGRRAVHVHVGQYTDDLVSTAIRNELARGGQVYYVSNRIANIDKASERVQTCVPEARVAVAHGQMAGAQLEDIMERFAAGQLDVLISTTIVESGIDNPHTNTLIIEDSQRLGLAQLYQLKGRVGRSHTGAYAYFLYPPSASLTPEAVERLEAIAEYDELGAGIKIALRDLEIRGAGSIIGSAQSGQLAAVGFDLFASMLSNAIAESRGQETVQRPDLRVELQISAFLPEDWMPEVDARIIWYRRLAAASDIEAVEACREQIITAWGEPPELAENLFALTKIRLLAQSLGASSVEVSKGQLLIRMDAPDEGLLKELSTIGIVWDIRRHQAIKTISYEENVASQVLQVLSAIVYGVARR
jgi:transcription-repair coupling factor (superfamily II helicase)